MGGTVARGADWNATDPPATVPRLLFVFDGEQPGDSFGGVSGIGDLNDDAVPDLLIAAPAYDGPNGTDSGRVYVYSGADRALIDTIDGPEASGYFGTAVGGGDVNGDEVDDFLVGGVFASGGSGRVFAYSGADRALLGSSDGGPADLGFFGSTILSVADMDGDGVEDWIVGAPNAGTTYANGAIVALSGVDLSVLGRRNGRFDSGYGSAMAAVPDVNGDGVEDIVVGGPNYPQNGDPILGPGAGYIEVLSGADLSPIYEVFGASSYQYFGAVVAGLPDISEDGGGDVAVAEPYAFTPGPSGVVATGRVKIYTGPTGDLALSIDGESEGELFGVGVSRAGDVDEDGFEDLVIGAPYWGTAGSERIGRLAVYSARTGAKIYEVTGEAPFDGFTGGGLVGDLTGDGIPEFVAAATGHDGPGGEDAGRVYVYDLHHRPTLEPCADADGDGYAVRTEPGAEMHFPWYDAVCGYVDCDDADAAVHPFAAETPGDGVDQNCNGSFACGALPADAAGRPWAYGIPFAGIVVALAVWRRRLA